MTVDGSAPFSTATVNDLTLDADGHFTASFPDLFRDFNLVAGSSIQAEVIDEDSFSDDSAFICNLNATAAEARGRVLICTDARGGFGALIFPR